MNRTLSFLAGIYFAIVQYAYYFLLEAYLSSSAMSFFIALVFWLIGFLIGLNIKKTNRLIPLISLSAVAYYCGFLVNQIYPFNKNILFLISILIVISGISPGYFFVACKNNFAHIKQLFIYENNGFIVGLFFSLLAILFYGDIFLQFGILTILSLIMIVYFYTTFQNKLSWSKK